VEGRGLEMTPPDLDGIIKKGILGGSRYQSGRQPLVKKKRGGGFSPKESPKEKKPSRPRRPGPTDNSPSKTNRRKESR